MKCYRCKVEMKADKTLQNIPSTGAPDFPENTRNSVGQTMYVDLSRAVFVSVQKCPECGHSD